MKRIEKRLNKLEKIIKSKYQYPGVFIVLYDDNKYKILNYDIKCNCFNNREELEKYILNNFECDKYIIISF